MTVAFDAVGTGVVNGSSWTHTASGADRVVLVAAGFGTAANYSLKSNTFSATYDGVPMTQVGVVFPNNGNSVVVVLFALLNPSTTPNALVAIDTLGTATRARFGNSVSYTGVSAVNATTSPVFGSAPSGSISVPSSSQDWAVGVFSINNSSGVGTLTQTQRFNGGASGTSTALGVGLADAPGAPSVLFGATFPSSSAWGATGVSMVNASTPIAATDTASATDVGVIAANRPEADGGSTGDAGSVAARLPSSESGVFAETQRIAVASSDSGVAAEGNAVNVAAEGNAVNVPKPSTDTAVGSETAAVTAKTVAADIAVGTDIAAVSAKNPASDTGSHTDAGKVLAFIKSGDTSVWLEAAGAITAASSSDSAHAADGGGVVLPGYSPTAKRTWTIPASVRVTVIDREDRTWRVPRGEHSYKPAPGTAPYTLPFTLTA